ncbi:MAG: radical SAM protein [Candidatus Cloacimonetes bacterium]|nr:radical SAM protein [Candidatus Cloacimonadota bacterium]
MKSGSDNILKRLRHLPRILQFFRNYRIVNQRVLASGIPLRELIVLKYPRRLPDAAKPPALTVEFTDACDLACRYCNNPLFPYPRTFMEADVFEKLCRRIEEADINRVRVGGGEPTLHTDTGKYLKALSARVKFLSIVTNAQWKRKTIVNELLTSGVDMIEISIDAGGAEYYESSRENASYALLLENLKQLRLERKRLRSKTIVKVRLMVRPSTLHLEKDEITFLRHYVDCVLPQYIMKHPDSDYDEDVFFPEHVVKHEYPMCTIIFKDMQVLMDGSVPLCQPKGSALGEDEKIFVGNIMEQSILDIWNGELPKKVRNAQRHRIAKDMKCCQGCNSA